MFDLDEILMVEHSCRLDSNDVELRNFQQEQLEHPEKFELLICFEIFISIRHTSIQGPLATQSLDGPQP